MRRLVFVICAVFAAASVVFSFTLAAKAQSADQYGSSDATGASSNPQESTAPDDDQPGADFISQGLVTGERSAAAAKAAQEDLAEEEQLPDYSQAVDNTTKDAFRATGWKVQRDPLANGGSSVVAGGSKAKPARFEMKIPTDNDYSVYARWPETAKSGTARYGVQTASGTKWSAVEQGADTSGMWVKLGTFAMEEGRRSVQVAAKSVGGGQVVADAVAVVRGETTAPPEEEAAGPSASGARATTDSRARPTGRDVVRQSRRHLGTPYGSSPCRINVKEDCACHTKLVFKKFGYNLPDHPGRQWNYGRKIAKSNLRPGDLVFFDDTRNGSIRDAHDGVGIYSGNGYYISGNSYFGKVVEKEMKWRKGYFGAKRLRLR